MAGAMMRTFAEAAEREQIRKPKGGADPLSAFVAAVGKQPDQLLTWDVVDVGCLPVCACRHAVTG